MFRFESDKEMKNQFVKMKALQYIYLFQRSIHNNFVVLN